MICPIWERFVFTISDDWKCTTADACGVVDSCDMHDDEETTWIEKWATLLNSKHVETQFAIILSSSSSSCVVDTQNTQTAVNEEWKIDLTAFTISYSHSWSIRTPQEKINKMHKKMTKKDEALRTQSHTYIRTNMKTGVDMMMIVQITNFEWLYATLCLPYKEKSNMLFYC